MLDMNSYLDLATFNPLMEERNWKMTHCQLSGLEIKGGAVVVMRWWL